MVYLHREMPITSFLRFYPGNYSRFAFIDFESFTKHNNVGLLQIQFLVTFFYQLFSTKSPCVGDISTRLAETTRQIAITWTNGANFIPPSRVVPAVYNRCPGYVSWPASHVIAMLFLLVIVKEAAVSVKLSHLG